MQIHMLLPVDAMFCMEVFYIVCGVVFGVRERRGAVCPVSQFGFAAGNAKYSFLSERDTTFICLGFLLCL